LHWTGFTRWDEAEDFFADVVEVSGMFQIVVRRIREMSNLSAQPILNLWTLSKKI
jgi:hypothetical protein